MTGGFLIELDDAAERVFRILNLLLLSINVITLNIYASELHSFTSTSLKLQFVA
jgi:hypothetical protein